MKTLILGGVKSGKSRHAEVIAASSGCPVTVIATAQPHDTEMRHRIYLHQRQRPPGWQLVEEPLALGAAISEHSAPDRFVIIDCLTLWLTQLLGLGDQQRLQDELQRLLNAVSDIDANIALVGNESSMGVTPLGALTREYCDRAGVLHQQLAARCDTVILTIAGLPQYLKGGPPSLRTST
jgi:adenosylcobinamide kinase/adenosylcobinamide-phosphate guanylyltransferase